MPVVKVRFIALLLSVVLMAGYVCPALAQGLYPPMVWFHIPEYVAHLGRQVSVVVECSTPKRVPRDNNVFELRNHRGTVLDRRPWTDPEDYLTFRFTVTQDLLGGNELSVWWNGRCVTQNSGYAAFSDPELMRITRLEPEMPAIALTIVCGGGSDRQVDELLAVLDKHQVKCTFFLGGLWLEKNVEAARRILLREHELGSHGYQHVYMTELSFYHIRNDMMRNNRRCEELLGVRPRLYRAPFSKTDATVTTLCRAEGMEEVQWNIDSQDWSAAYADKPKQLLQRVTDASLVSGSVIQFHLDGYHTAEVLDQAIPFYLNECGYRVVTVSELMALSGRELPPLPDISPDN